ncbi:hypothetical protein Tco_0908395 [Tanacetum coccineum]|uniref:Uncharacterized protein n=1 Tax=Tanacetum coccineum TaxID=301880 RepID=A0ABQ5CN44_9ASTR
MKRQGKYFSGRETPLFQTIMVQAQEEGKGSVMPVVPQHTHAINQPSSSKPPNKQKPRKTKKQNIKVSQPSDSTKPIADETKNVESVPTHSNDPLLSEIAKLKERVKKLERRNKSRTPRLKMLRKVGRTARIDSSKDEGLGDQDDASKQESKIVNIDANEGEVEVEKVVSTAEVTTVSATPTTVDELNLAQTLIEIKAAKPKVVTTAATTTTTTVIRPKARGVIVQEPNADYVLAARLQAQEHEELTIEERSKMFVEIMDKRKKHFARLKAEEQRRKSPTKAQKRTQRRQRWYKKAGEELEFDKSKKQKLDENVEAEVDDEAEMKKHMEIVPNDEIAIDAIPLATKSPIIYSSMIKMLHNIDREDLETLWKLVKSKHGNTRPEEAYERVLWGDLKVMFEPDVESKVWRNLQGYNMTIWKLFSLSGVYFVKFQNLHIFMLVEKKYPLTPTTITKMLNKKLQTDHWNEMCYQLLKLMTKQLKNPRSV